MNRIELDEMFMRRCLQLARNGRVGARPNPMVGAVIVDSTGRIIGEGYHAKFGEAHAEVNAFESISASNEHLLSGATVYVSLEPCSHYGKTPPCADLIIRKGVRRVVCGSIDPFSSVHGRGIERIKKAGIEIAVGVLEDECLELNRQFVVRNTLHRPYIILKWAQTADGFIGTGTTQQLHISTTFTQMLVHKMRAETDAIIVGNRTEQLEHPQLNVRFWSGRNPEKIVLSGDINILGLLSSLYDKGAQSIIVEGGANTLNSFINKELWDELHVETSTYSVGPIPSGVRAPLVPSSARLIRVENYGNIIETYLKCRTAGSKL